TPNCRRICAKRRTYMKRLRFAFVTMIALAAIYLTVVSPSAHGPDYGFLWWLNTKQGQWPGSPKDAYWALGSGGNYVYVDPAHDLVVVSRASATSSDGVHA